MALKGQKTKASYLDWDKMTILLQKLARDENYKFELLIAVGCYTGLRISDILVLKWFDVMNIDTLELIEKKTGKIRKIRLNPELIEIIERMHIKLEVEDDSEFLFTNRYKTKAFNVQYANRRLKEIFKHYKIRIPYFSTHTFRKTHG